MKFLFETFLATSCHLGSFCCRVSVDGFVKLDFGVNFLYFFEEKDFVGVGPLRIRTNNDVLHFGGRCIADFWRSLAIASSRAKSKEDLMEFVTADMYRGYARWGVLVNDIQRRISKTVWCEVGVGIARNCSVEEMFDEERKSRIGGRCCIFID